MAQYAVIIYEREGVDMPPEVMAAHEALGGRIVEAGGREVAGLALEPTTTARSVRGGVITDGPFIEAKEVIGGYALFELPGKAEALAAATEFMQLHVDLFPGWEGTCEVRPFTPGP